MYQQLLRVTAVFCALVLLASCIEYDYREAASVHSLASIITDFAVFTSGNEENHSEQFVATINQSDRTIRVFVPPEVLGSPLLVRSTTFENSQIVSPDITEPVDFQDPATFIVDGYDGINGARVRREYTVTVEAPRAEDICESIDNETYLLIYNEAYLLRIGHNGNSKKYLLDKSYCLVNNIELTDDFLPIGSTSEPFIGAFDGGENIISNLRISQISSSYVGLFAQIGVTSPSDPDDNGVVRDLTLVLAEATTANPSISGGQYVGALAGASYGHLESVNVSGGLVAGSAGDVGGLIGINDGTITTSSASSTVEVTGNNVGGLVGSNNGTIEKSFAEGEVIASGSNNVGGLVGIHDNGTTGAKISESFASVDVEGQDYVGGLIGFNNLEAGIYDSYAAGSVAGSGFVGGFVGHAGNLNEGSITRSYTIAVVVKSGSNAGIFAGSASHTSGINITHSYYADNARGLTGPNLVIGNVKNDDLPDTVSGFNIEDVGQGTFDGWDFDGSNSDGDPAVWRWMDDGQWPQLAALPGQSTGIASGTVIPPVTSCDPNVLGEICISSEEDLGKIGTTGFPLDGYYVLENNITLTGEFDPIGSTSKPFTGTFDGNNKTISNLRIAKSGEDYVGLFGQIGDANSQNPDDNGVVRDLTLALAAATTANPSSISGRQYVGALAGASYGHVESVNVSGGLVAGSAGDVGGLVGSNNGTITTSSASSTVEVTGNNVGGLVGNNDGTIEKSFAEGEVIASGSTNVGGLVGTAGGTITSSYAAVDVEGQNRVGGLIGLNEPDGRIYDSYSAGSVEGKDFVGGFVGDAGNPKKDSITRSYTIALVVKWVSNAGIFAGSASHTSGINITHSYYADNARGLTGPNLVIGNVKNDDLPDTVSGFNIEDVGQGTFDGWDFDGSNSDGDPAVWRWMDDGQWPQLAALPGQSTGIASGTVIPPVTSCDPNVLGEICISSEEDLGKIGTTGFPLDGYYVLENNITLTGEFDPIGSTSKPFTGTFDGNNKTISNLRIAKSGEDYVGLFGQIGDANSQNPDDNGVVRDLTLTLAAATTANPSSISGGQYVGALAGASYGHLESVNVSGGLVAGSAGDVGGLIGINDGTITTSSASSTVEVTGNNVGGLVGSNNGTITTSSASSTVEVTGNNVGGLVGSNDGTIEKSFAEGEVIASGSTNVGGLVGIHGSAVNTDAEISESFAAVDVKGQDYVGAFVGLNYEKVSDSYAAGSVEGNGYVGGFVGSNAGRIENCYTIALVVKWVSNAGIFAGGNSGTIIASYYAEGINDPSSINGDAFMAVYDIEEVGQGAFNGWDFSGAVWRWMNDGQWPQLAGLPGQSTGIAILIRNETELGKIGIDDAYPLYAHYKLTNNITLSGDFISIGSTPQPFIGHFDGRGKEIRNLRISQDASSYVGLFAQIGVTDRFDSDNPNANGMVRDLTLALAAATTANPSSISGRQYVGALAGASYGHVESVNVSGGLVAGSAGDVGGLIGINGGTITTSSASSTVEVTGNNVGGLVGNNGGTIEKSFAEGEVIASGSNNVGGLVGIHGRGNTDAKISESFAAVGVKGQNYVGAFVGLNYANVSDSYATGSVEGDGYVGGFVGSNDGSTGSTGSIENCYTIALVVKWVSNAGRFAGGNRGGGTITASYYAEGIGGPSIINGDDIVVADAQNASDVTGSPLLAEIQRPSTNFSAWDFDGTNSDGNEDIWRWMNDGQWPQLAALPGQSTGIASGTGIPSDTSCDPSVPDVICISSEEELSDIGTKLEYPLDGYYVLANDITLSNSFSTIGNDSNPFTGTFDGKGHKISDLLPEALFWEIGSGGKVHNLVLEDVAVTSNSGVNLGALARFNNGTIEEVGVNSGEVNAGNEGNIGGLVGSNESSGKIIRSYAKVNVTGSSTGTYVVVGGLAGFNAGRIENSYATGEVTGTTNSTGTNNYVGGLVGLNSTPIAYSYATGKVTGTTHVGGLVGSNNGTITLSYFDSSTDSTGQTSGVGLGSGGGVSGLVGNNIDSNSFPTSWDFTDVWTHVSAGSEHWPRLQWEF